MKHLVEVPSAGAAGGYSSRLADRRKYRLVHCVVGLIAPLIVSCATANSGTPEAPVLPDAVKVENLQVQDSLIGQAGDPAEGRKVFADRKLGNCLACHSNSDMSDQQFHGEVGPKLDGVASRWSEGQLRTIVINAKTVFTAETVMPGFYSLDVGTDVRKDLIGKTILTAQQVEDVVAYLATLK